MKTAMQELIEIINERPTEISQFNAVQLLKLIEPLLEKEKEQIKLAFREGKDYCGEITSIDYYNQTYLEKESGIKCHTFS
jgi:hypothetical protein